MVLLVVLTRKIKRKEFKDSKKTNTLVVTVALIFNMGIGVLTWIMLRLHGRCYCTESSDSQCWDYISFRSMSAIPDITQNSAIDMCDCRCRQYGVRS